MIRRPAHGAWAAAEVPRAQTLWAHVFHGPKCALSGGWTLCGAAQKCVPAQEDTEASFWGVAKYAGSS